MNWTIENASSTQVLHSSTCDDSTESAIKTFVLIMADYALSMLGDSIEDNAMYCMFEWDEENSTLAIGVTDHSKKNDGKNIVKAVFSGIEQASIEDKIDTIKFWLRDHLTTSSDYMKFSLVAGFSRDGRTTVELM